MAVYQNLAITQLSQDQEKNCSTIRIVWKSTQTGASYNMVEATGVYAVYVNGQEHRETVQYVLPKQTEQVILDKEVTVFHDSKGEALVEVETWMDTSISAGEVELYEKLQLTTIPRVSRVLGSDAVIGKASRLAIIRRNSTYTHSVAWQFGRQCGYVDENGEASPYEAVFSGESLDFLIPEDFYQELPDQKSDLCTLTVHTYSEGVLVGQPQSSQFRISVNEQACKPIVWGEVEDVCAATTALTGDPRMLVKYMSTAQCTIYSQAQKWAQIQCNMIAGTQVDDTLEIPGVQTDSISFSATDSRGLSTEYVSSADMVPYRPVTCEAEAKRLSPVSDEAVLKISGNYYNGSFGVAENTLSLSYSIGSGERIPVEATVTEDHRYSAAVSLSGMDYTKLYHIAVYVSDLLTCGEKRITLKKGVPVFDWGEADFAFHVPVKMDNPLPVESGGTGGTVPAEIWANIGLCLNMEPGVEYATWEKWDGKPVYTKLVQYGAMPNNGCYGILHHCGAVQVLRCFGTSSDGRTLPCGSSRGGKIELFCDSSSVYLDTQQDESSYTAQVQLFYIKNQEE